MDPSNFTNPFLAPSAQPNRPNTDFENISPSKNYTAPPGENHRFAQIGNQSPQSQTDRMRFSQIGLENDFDHQPLTSTENYQFSALGADNQIL